jgi:hypothetical protein
MIRALNIIIDLATFGYRQRGSFGILGAGDRSVSHALLDDPGLLFTISLTGE